MTDARFPERWLNDRRFNRLTDREFRAYVYALAWSVANKTDGLLEDDDTSMIPFFDVAHTRDLAQQDLWERRSGAWFIVDFPETQTSRRELEQLAAGRAAERLRKQRQRAKNKSSSEPGRSTGAIASATGSDSIRFVSLDVPADVAGDITRPGKGQGQAEARNVELTDDDAIFTGWANAA